MLVASVTVGVVEAVGVTGGVEDEFALFEFPEFVRSGDRFCAAAPLKLETEELTDIELAGVAAALRRAASWSHVTQTGAPSDFWAQSLPTVAAAAERLSVLVVEAVTTSAPAATSFR